MKTTQTLVTIAVSQALMLSLSCSAFAAPNAPAGGSDYFSRISQSTMRAQAKVSTPATNASVKTPADWFAKFDEARAKLRPQAADRVILSRPFNQELERVQQWITTASRVAKNYRTLSHTIRNIAVPPGTTGIKEYRDLTADWYADAASVYEDLTAPRKPAKTIEELEDTLNEIKARAQSVGQSHVNLQTMETNLRQTYSVIAADDALQQYVSGK